MLSENNLKWVSVLLLCTTIVAGAFGLYKNQQLINLSQEYQKTLDDMQGTLDDYTVTVNIKLDYGDGTVEWYNDTLLSLGESLLNATLRVVDVKYQESDYGAFILTINEVGEDLNSWWLWSYYDDGWQSGMVGADQWTLHDGDIVSWTYTTF